MNLTEILKALSDENRMRIFCLLTQQELCVCEMEVLLKISQSNASRHLSKLKAAQLIGFERKAHWVTYRVHEAFKAEHPLIYQAIANSVQAESQLQSDSERLHRYREGCHTCESIHTDKKSVMEAIEKINETGAESSTRNF